MSRRPWRARPASTAAPTSRALVTSAATASASGPIAAATSCTPAPLRSSSTTLAPSRAKVRAISAPKPDAAPVTSAILPARRMRSSKLELDHQIRDPTGAAHHRDPADERERAGNPRSERDRGTVVPFRDARIDEAAEHQHVEADQEQHGDLHLKREVHRVGAGLAD